MATGRGTKLTGSIGEFLVSAELCRRGLLATPFSGNVPHYDIIASDEFGGHMVIQVKAINKINWQFNARKFVEIAMDGDRQILGTPVEEPCPCLYCVFVALGESCAEDRYFVFSWEELRSLIIDHYREYLEKHGGVRPKAPASTHCSVSIAELESFENQWEHLLIAIRSSRLLNKRTRKIPADKPGEV
ncbi:hypothetical protein JWJ90_13500 [Desulfobulbus rhabdoformis]|uniref:hypothetical protein n=1 Tax=Desulfobulbus rhabdoformis TaxID=34032 RepID=UPI001964A362|nr:hypothetical protein [Desulfobulbus rhabdoformis]MBM9615294.1 hypothetical protein [Desulfobulbus rhabdoformis]